MSELRTLVEYGTNLVVHVPFAEPACRPSGVAHTADFERAQVPAALQPHVPEELVERLERGIRRNLEMDPEV